MSPGVKGSIGVLGQGEQARSTGVKGKRADKRADLSLEAFGRLATILPGLTILPSRALDLVRPMQGISCGVGWLPVLESEQGLWLYSRHLSQIP